MGKQKYPTNTTGTSTEGQPKQRDHTKTGKLAKRRELRRLEAIARQVDKIKQFEANLDKAKNKDEAQRKLAHAQLTLQKIRGGVPHKELEKKFAVEPEKKS